MAWSLRSFLMFICYLIAVSHTQVGTKHLCTHVNLHTHHAANAYMHALADSQWLACEQVYNQVDLMAAMLEGLSCMGLTKVVNSQVRLRLTCFDIDPAEKRCNMHVQV